MSDLLIGPPAMAIRKRVRLIMQSERTHEEKMRLLKELGDTDTSPPVGSVKATPAKLAIVWELHLLTKKLIRQKRKEAAGK